MKALVIKSTGSWYDVEAENGNLYKCRIKGKFRTKQIKSTNPVVVGDYVEIISENENWMINKLYERKNKIFNFIDDLLNATGKIGDYDQKI